MGAGPSYASEIGYYKPSDMIWTEDKTANPYEKTMDSMTSIAKVRTTTILTQITILNRTGFPLEYANCGSSSGYWFTNPKDGFGSGTGLMPKACGGMIHTKTSDVACGSVGYVSFRVKTPGKNYTVCFGFEQPHAGTNHAGLQIRGESGVTDDLGHITGHGVDATGCVTGISKLAKTTKHSVPDTYHEYSEACRCFKLTLKFGKDGRTWYHLFVDEV